MFLLGRAIPFVVQAGAALTGLTSGPAPQAANPRVAASLSRLSATFEGNIDKFDDVHLGAAAREMAGEVVAWNAAANRPFDHVTEVRSAANGMRNVIRGISNVLQNGRPSEEQRRALEALRDRARAALERAQEAGVISR